MLYLLRKAKLDNDQEGDEIINNKTNTKADNKHISLDVREEIINGQIYHNQTPNRIHQEVIKKIARLINDYLKFSNCTGKVHVAPFKIDLSLEKVINIVKPDISVICDMYKLTDRGGIVAPDWIIEIVSLESSINDYIVKLKLYLSAGVREYWIVNPLNESILIYNFEKLDFAPYIASFTENIQVNIFNDLYININHFTI